jgi:hypothetical protein
LLAATLFDLSVVPGWRPHKEPPGGKPVGTMTDFSRFAVPNREKPVG